MRPDRQRLLELPAAKSPATFRRWARTCVGRRVVAVVGAHVDGATGSGQQEVVGGGGVGETHHPIAPRVDLIERGVRLVCVVYLWVSRGAEAPPRPPASVAHGVGTPPAPAPPLGESEHAGGQSQRRGNTDFSLPFVRVISHPFLSLLDCRRRTDRRGERFQKTQRAARPLPRQTRLPIGEQRLQAPPRGAQRALVLAQRRRLRASGLDHVGARRRAAVAPAENPLQLHQRKTDRRRRADQSQARQRLRPVLAIAVDATPRCRQQAAALVVAHRVDADSRSLASAPIRIEEDG